MNKKLKIALSIVLALILVISGYLIYYANDYSHADSSVNALLNGTENVTVNKIDKGLFLDGPGNESSIIFDLIAARASSSSSPSALTSIVVPE